MANSRYWLVGREQSGYRKLLWPSIGVFLFLATFVAYAAGVFAVEGGLVWIPGDAALVGFLAAVLVGYDHGGLIVAWLISYAAFLGYRADHAFMGLSSRTRIEQAAYFLQLEGLVILAIEALIIGSLAFLLGVVTCWGITRLRQPSLTDS